MGGLFTRSRKKTIVSSTYEISGVRKLRKKNLMKIIDRYIFRELVAAFLLSISLLMSAFLTHQMLRFSRISSETGINFLVLIKLSPFIIPFFLVLAIPLSALIASTLIFSKLSTDHEITALRSAGVSVYRLLLPVSLFLIGAFLLGMFSSTTLQPMANRYLRLQSYETLKGQGNLGLQEGVFNNLFNLLIYVQKLKDGDTLDRVLISDRSSKESKIIIARRGRFLSDPSTENVYLRLENGRIHFGSEDKSSYQIATFSVYYLRLEATKSIERTRLFKEVWGMSLDDLKKRMEEMRIEGQEREYRKLLIEFHKKFSLPAVVLVLGVLGVPLGIKSRFSSRFAGFIVSIVIIFFYYIIDTGFEIVAVEGLINPVWGAWMPVIIFLLLAISATVKVSRERL